MMMAETELSDAALEKIIRGVVDGLSELAPRSYDTPPQIAKRLGIEPAKVIGWIRRGELRAVNVADQTGGRARWRVSQKALAEFMARRESQAPQNVTRRKRQPADLIEIV